MYSYTIQASKQSGETFVIEWDGDTIHGLCGPLDPREQEQAVQDLTDAGSFEYNYAEDGEAIPASPDDWQYPVATYDPNTEGPGGAA